MTELLTITERHARRRAIADFVRDNNSVADAARKFGVSINCAYASCNEFDVPLQNRRPSAARTCKLLFDLLYTNTPLLHLAEAHQVSVSRVHKVLTHARNAGFRFNQRQDRQRRES